MKTFCTSIYNPYLHFTYGSSAMEHSSIHVTQNSNSIMKTTQMQAITRNNDSQIYIYFLPYSLQVFNSSKDVRAYIELVALQEPLSSFVVQI